MGKKIIWLLLFIAFTLCQAIGSDFQFIGEVTNFNQKQNIVDIECNNAKVQIIILADDLVRVRMIHGQDFPTDFSYSVLPISKSPSVFPVEDQGNRLKISTKELAVYIQKSPCRISFYDLKDNLLCKDHDAYGMGWKDSKIYCWKELHDEPFYGLGEKTRGLNKRGNFYTMWNSDIPAYSTTFDPIYQSHPFFLSLYQGNGFGIFFDNSYRSQFNLGAGTDQFYRFGADSGLMDYYFFYGPNFNKILKRYGELVGTVPLPPKWSLGYQQCRWSYYPESEVMSLAHKFRDKEIPCDVIYLDIHYMDGYRCFTWHPENFPHPKKMVKNLSDMGFKVAVIIDPGIKVDPGYFVFQQGIEGDYFCKLPDGSDYQGQVWPGWCHFPDFSNQATRTWWGELHQNLINTGIMGFWDDMNEPATWGGTFPDMVQFSDEGRNSDHLKMHNLYGLLMARSTYEGVTKLRPEQRPFVLTRAGFSGVQRYSSVWTGDNVASWDHLKLAMQMCLGLSMSGVSFCGSDVGGFMGAPSPELFTRWIQLGAFTPLFRAHTCIDTPDQEPWSFGDRHEAINKNFIQLRYQLLPYLYDAFHESSKYNTPIMRPMVLCYQSDPRTIYMDDQFFFGEDLLIAPVYQQNQQSRNVYLPEGDWYDFWSGEQVTGPVDKLVSAPLERIPIFAKAGAIIPMQHTMNFVGEKNVDPLILHLFPKQGVTRDSLYEDDGISFDFKKGIYCITPFELSVQKNRLNFTTEKRLGKFSPANRSYLLKIHFTGQKPGSVNLNNNKLPEKISVNELGKTKSGWWFEKEKNELTVKYPDSGDKISLGVIF